MVNRVFPENDKPAKQRGPQRAMTKQLEAFDERIKAIKNNTERYRAHELMDLVETAAIMAKGKDKRRSAHWQEMLTERTDDLEEHLRVWG